MTVNGPSNRIVSISATPRWGTSRSGVITCRWPVRTAGAKVSSPSRTVNSGLGRCASAGVDGGAGGHLDQRRGQPFAVGARDAGGLVGEVQLAFQAVELAGDDRRRRCGSSVPSRRTVPSKVVEACTLDAGGGRVAVLSPVSASASCVQYSTARTAWAWRRVAHWSTSSASSRANRSWRWGWSARPSRSTWSIDTRPAVTAAAVAGMSTSLRARRSSTCAVVSRRARRRGPGGWPRSGTRRCATPRRRPSGPAAAAVTPARRCRARCRPITKSSSSASVRVSTSTPATASIASSSWSSTPVTMPARYRTSFKKQPMSREFLAATGLVDALDRRAGEPGPLEQAHRAGIGHGEVDLGGPCCRAASPRSRTVPFSRRIRPRRRAGGARCPCRDDRRRRGCTTRTTHRRRRPGDLALASKVRVGTRTCTAAQPTTSSLS